MTVLSIVAHDHHLSWASTLMLATTSTLSSTPPTVHCWIHSGISHHHGRDQAGHHLGYSPHPRGRRHSVGIEGAASYGSILAGTVAGSGFPVVDAPRMDTKLNRGVGKPDALDSHRIARTVLALSVEKLRWPRLNEGIRQGL